MLQAQPGNPSKVPPHKQALAVLRVLQGLLSVVCLRLDLHPPKLLLTAGEMGLHKSMRAAGRVGPAGQSSRQLQSRSWASR